MTKNNFNAKLTDERRIKISFVFPLYFRYKVIHTEITQRDLLKMIRKTQDSILRKQLKDFIKQIDDNSEFKTDINGQYLSKDKQQIKSYNRIIEMVDEDLRTKC